MLFDLATHPLRVPVHRTKVELCTERERRCVVLFLRPGGTPADVLEEQAPFFPAEVNDTIELVARATVRSLMVETTDAAPMSLAAAGVGYEARPILVTFRMGDTLRGDLMVVSGTARTLEILNESSRSFTVRAEGRVVHVAKAHVERVEELR